MPGPSVTIVDSGGLAVTQVEAGAPVFTGVEAGGLAVTLVESGGIPMVIEGNGPNPDAAIIALFANGEQGGWYDPSDMSNMFQDTAGTTPVTGAGQLVARINDKSGNGNHIIQATEASRPIYQVDGSGNGYLLFDGSNDGLSTSGNVDFTGTNKFTILTGVRKASDAAIASLVELSANATTTNNSFVIFAPLTGTVYTGRQRISINAEAIATPFAAGTTHVVTMRADTVAPLTEMRVNGVSAASNTGNPGTGSFGNYPLYVGRRGGASLPFNGRIYAMIVRGAATSGDLLTDAEAWVNDKAGAF